MANQENQERPETTQEYLQTSGTKQKPSLLWADNATDIYSVAFDSMLFIFI